MAVNDESPPSESAEKKPEPAPASAPKDAPAASRAVEPSAGAPVWVVPLYVGGPVLVYLGERVLASMPTWRWIATGLGLMAVLAATVVRFAPRFRVGGERRDIEQLLAILSLLGIVALAVYAATTEWGQEKLGIDASELETKERVLGALTVLWVALVLVSVVPMLFAEGALYPMRRALFPESRRVRAAAASGITLVLAALYGGLFTYAASGAELKADYSYFKTSRPSDSTRKMAESLSEPIKVTAFFPDVNEVRTEVESYLRELARGVPNLQVDVQDRLLVPKLARELRATQDGVIILTKDKTSETLSIGTDVATGRPKLKTLDRDFQERLLKLIRSRRTAYLTVGHGELNDASRTGQEPGRVAGIARTLLQKQNYVVKDLGLAQGLGNDVPDDADMVFVLGPSEPFAAEELSTLRRYADRGGKLLLALDPDALSSRDLEFGAEPGAEAGEPARPPEPAGSAARPDSKPKPSARPLGSAKPPASAKPAAKPPGSARALGSAKPPGSARPIASAKPAPSAKPASSVAEAPKPEVPTSLVPTTDAARSLVALAEIAGISIQGGILANDREHLTRRFNDSDNTLLVTNSFSSHASVSTLSRHSPRAAVVTIGSGGLERASGSTAKVDFTVRSRPGTFADTNRNYGFDEASEKRAVYNLAAAVSQPAKSPRPAKPEPKKVETPPASSAKKDDKKPPPDEMRAFVIADVDAFSDMVLAQFTGNQVLLLDAVRWLGGEESFAGEVTSEEDVRIEHTKEKDQVWFYSTIFGAPALVLGLGLIYVRRSRRTRPRGGER